jgi:hypothetical protein
MATLNQTIRRLEEQRRELLDQLESIDRSIAALNGVGMTIEETRPSEPDVPAEHTASTVLPRRVRPKRVLSDSHKQAVIVGRRNARAAKEAAKGLAREPLDDSFVPAIGRQGLRQPPRLVKRPIKK